MKKFEEKLNQQHAKIIELQSITAVQDIALQKLEVKCDNNEYYRRS